MRLVGALSFSIGYAWADALRAGLVRPRRRTRRRSPGVSLPRDDRHVHVQRVAVGQVAEGPLRHHAGVQHEQVPPAMASRVPGTYNLTYQ